MVSDLTGAWDRGKGIGTLLGGCLQITSERNRDCNRNGGVFDPTVYYGIATAVQYRQACCQWRLTERNNAPSHFLPRVKGLLTLHHILSHISTVAQKVSEHTSKQNWYHDLEASSCLTSVSERVWGRVQRHPKHLKMLNNPSHTLSNKRLPSSVSGNSYKTLTFVVQILTTVLCWEPIAKCSRMLWAG